MNRHNRHHNRGSTLQRFRKPIVVALAFLGFFVLSNYYMGFFTSNPPPPIRDTPVLPDPPSKADKSESPLSSEAVWQGGLDDAPDGVVPQKQTQGGNDKGDSSVAITEGDDDEDNVEQACKHTRNRDYSKDPIVISGRFSGQAECDVPCQGDSGAPDAVVGYRQTQCPHIKSIFFTMENSIPPPGAYDIVANTQLTSDVPVPYFSWAEYPFDTPVGKKTATAHVAAFISNCGPQRRLQWMETMMQHGIKIDSYGSCMRNKNIPSDYSNKYGGNYNALKVALVSTYKFTMAFENSATDDYVTEKLFGVLVAGSVPLYDGASNGKNFGPAAKSMIFAEDYGTPEKLAKYLLYLDSNNTAYEEYLQWKKKGPSDDWVALVDLANVHSNCRLCIRTADLHRKEIGPVKHGNPKGETKPSTSAFELHVRERGKYWLRNIYLTSKTIAQLKHKINTHVPHDTQSYLHSIYDLWTRTPVATDADVEKLDDKTELEAIFVIPQNWESRNLMW